MAMVTIISETTEAVTPGPGNQFTTTGPCTMYADDLAYNEIATVYRLGPKGYREATNKEGIIFMSAFPNMVYIDSPGTFRVGKTISKLAAAIAYEEV